MKQFTILAYGHENILALHSTTWQVTRVASITKNANCIIGVQADQATSSIPDWLKMHLNKSGRIQIILKINQKVFRSEAIGNKLLSFTDDIDIVFRKSSFVSPRTIGLHSTFVAKDLDDETREQLKKPSTRVEITISKI